MWCLIQYSNHPQTNRDWIWVAVYFSIKLVMGMLGHVHWPSFLFCSHPMIPTLNNSQPIFDNLFPNDSYFTTFHGNFEIVCQKYVEFVFRMENWSKSNSLYLTFFFFLFFLFFFFFFSLNVPFFWRKISHWKTPSFKLVSKHPRHFQNWVPSPPPTHLIQVVQDEGSVPEYLNSKITHFEKI